MMLCKGICLVFRIIVFLCFLKIIMLNYKFCFCEEMLRSLVFFVCFLDFGLNSDFSRESKLYFLVVYLRVISRFFRYFFFKEVENSKS